MSQKKILESALTESVRDAFRTLLNVEVDVSDPLADDQGNVELICTVGAAGKLEGSLSVSLPNQSACVIVSRMLQESITQVTADVCDGMCEMANMIAGGVKVRVSGEDCSFEISIPTVVQGKLMRISVMGDVDRIRKRFKAEDFVFDVEFMFKFNHGKAATEAVTVKSVSKIRALERLKAMTVKSPRE